MFGSALVLALTSIGSVSGSGTLSSPSNTHDKVEVEAEPPGRSVFAARPLSFELRLGVATPTGALGLAIEYSFIAPLALGCGLGTNLLGWEPACWLRARLLTRPEAAWTLSSGFSTSTYAQTETTRAGVLGLVAPAGLGESTTNELNFQHAYWWNSDVGFEVRQSGLVIREFLGVTALLNPSAGVPVVYASNNKPAESPIDLMAYAGFGIGFAP